MLQLHMWAFKDIFATQKVGLGGVAYIYICIYIWYMYAYMYMYIYIHTYILYTYIINHHRSHFFQVERFFRQKQFFFPRDME